MTRLGHLRLPAAVAGALSCVLAGPWCELGAQEDPMDADLLLATSIGSSKDGYMGTKGGLGYVAVGTSALNGDRTHVLDPSTIEVCGVPEHAYIEQVYVYWMGELPGTLYHDGVVHIRPPGLDQPLRLGAVKMRTARAGGTLYVCRAGFKNWSRYRGSWYSRYEPALPLYGHDDPSLRHDITRVVRQHGANGVYQLSGLEAASPEITAVGGKNLEVPAQINLAGWALVIIYSSPSVNTPSCVRIWDGLEFIETGERQRRLLASDTESESTGRGLWVSLPETPWPKACARSSLISGLGSPLNGGHVLIDGKPVTGIEDVDGSSGPAFDVDSFSAPELTAVVNDGDVPQKDLGAGNRTLLRMHVVPEYNHIALGVLVVQWYKEPNEAFWFWSGVAARERGDVATAVDAFRQAMRSDGCRTIAYQEMAGVLADQGKYRRAHAVLKQGRARFPGAASLWAYEGSALSLAGQMRQAAELLEAGRTRHPRDPLLLIQLAHVSATLGRRKMAGQALAQLDHDELLMCPQACIAAAQIYRSLGSNAEAIQLLDRLRYILPDRPIIHAELAEACMAASEAVSESEAARGRLLARAAFEFSRALQIDPDGPAIREELEVAVRELASARCSQQRMGIQRGKPKRKRHSSAPRADGPDTR